MLGQFITRIKSSLPYLVQSIHKQSITRWPFWTLHYWLSFCARQGSGPTLLRFRTHERMTNIFHWGFGWGGFRCFTAKAFCCVHLSRLHTTDKLNAATLIPTWRGITNRTATDRPDWWWRFAWTKKIFIFWFRTGSTSFLERFTLFFMLLIILWSRIDNIPRSTLYYDTFTLTRGQRRDDREEDASTENTL